MTATPPTLASTLLGWLDRDDAVNHLAAYFAEPSDERDRASMFTGRWFERLEGGGDHRHVSQEITASDLVAVEMLSVSVPAETAIDLLHGRLGRSISELLREIPIAVSLADPQALDHLTDDAPASRAWTLLEAQHGVGWVTAGKLMARKRPHLIPVYDEVVKCALGGPSGFWLALHEAMTDPEVEIGARLGQLRRDGHVPSEVSDLRILDVVLWMGHRNAHGRGECPAPGVRAAG